MHRMNANRVTEGGTSALNDDSLSRIRDRVFEASNRRAKKHQRTASIKKNAKKESASTSTAQSNTKRIVIASLSDIPSDFERIGTGFFRQGHHLWEIMPGDGGYVLVRKRGEDHVLGHDPEPIDKTAATLITDRNGCEIKQGSRVSLPHHGKVATGTVVVLSPRALGVDLDQGGNVDVPPDMVEWAEEEASESEHAETGEAVKQFVEEEMQEEEHSSDKEGSDVFEPDISEKPTSDHVGPQSAQSGGIGGVAADHDDPDGSRNVMANKKTAQMEAPAEPAAEPGETEQGPPTLETFQPTDATSGIASRLDNMGDQADITIWAEDQNRYWYATKSGDEYSLYMVETKLEKLPDISSAEDLAKFEQNVGRMTFTADRRIASLIKTALASQVDLKSWREYWHAVGQRVAEKGPPKPPKPKMTDEEKKQKARERRKERQIERAGLPPGTKLPPKPKTGKKDADDLAKVKEYNKILEQALDAIAYAIETVADPQDDVLVADAVAQELERMEEEKARLDEDGQEEMDDSLSLNEPSESELDGIDITRSSSRKQANKIVVSMTDL